MTYPAVITADATDRLTCVIGTREFALKVWHPDTPKWVCIAWDGTVTTGEGDDDRQD